MSETIAFKPIYLETNQGHGNARRVSLMSCMNDLVALMDADDISIKNRFQLQIQRFVNKPDLSIVGGQISEFSGNQDNVIGIRKVPEAHEDIKAYAKKRCPMNQVSVMFDRRAVEAAGGYVDWYCEEDYYLWLRMLEKGHLFENVPEVLVNVRAGEEMSSRRGGLKYFKSEVRLQKYMFENGIISLSQYLFNVAIRFGGEVVLSNRLRTRLFKFMRQDADDYKSVTDNKNKEKEATAMDINTFDNYPPFSVAMCVYGKDNPEWFDIALESVINQTVKPSEIVLVVDGPVPDGIQDVIDKYSEICKSGGTASSHQIP